MSETQNDNNEKSQNYLKIICRIGNWAIRLMFFFLGAGVASLISIVPSSGEDMMTETVLAFLLYNVGWILSVTVVFVSAVVGLKLKKKYPDPD